MAQIIIRNLDDSTKALFAAHARENGVSMEEYARQVIRKAVDSEQPETGLGSQMSKLFSGCLLEEALELPPRQPVQEPRVTFDDHS